MKDREHQTFTSVEILKDEFQTHLKSVEFGSSDYLAYCDYFALENQKSLRRIDIKNAADTNTPGNKLFRESELRITETRIALLENEIDQRKIRDIEYAKAYKRIEDAMRKLYGAILDEEKSENPDISDGRLVHEFARDRFHDMLLDDFRDKLYRQQN